MPPKLWLDGGKDFLLGSFLKSLKSKLRTKLRKCHGGLTRDGDDDGDEAAMVKR